MKKTTILAFAAALAGAAAYVLLSRREDAPETAPPEPAPVDGDKTQAFALRNKYVDYSDGEDKPVYLFELQTPAGSREVAVTAEQYETYYIGDEVICVEQGRNLTVV